MTRIGLPVPPGFTITTEACRAYLRTGAVPDGLFAEVEEHLRELEMTHGQDASATRPTRCCSRCAPAASSRCPG